MKIQNFITPRYRDGQLVAVGQPNAPLRVENCEKDGGCVELHIDGKNVAVKASELEAAIRNARNVGIGL